MKIKVIHKFATGDVIPEGAIYLNTIVQDSNKPYVSSEWKRCWLVWHYFLVEVDG
jgi:hypothetical protein